MKKNGLLISPSTLFGVLSGNPEALGTSSHEVDDLYLRANDNLGPLYTHFKSHDHDNLRALENHLKAIPKEMESNFANDGPSNLI